MDFLFGTMLLKFWVKTFKDFYSLKRLGSYPREGVQLSAGIDTNNSTHWLFADENFTAKKLARKSREIQGCPTNEEGDNYMYWDYPESNPEGAWFVSRLTVKSTKSFRQQVPDEIIGKKDL